MKRIAKCVLDHYAHDSPSDHCWLFVRCSSSFARSSNSTHEVGKRSPDAIRFAFSNCVVVSQQSADTSQTTLVSAYKASCSTRSGKGVNCTTCDDSGQALSIQSRCDYPHRNITRLVAFGAPWASWFVGCCTYRWSWRQACSPASTMSHTKATPAEGSRLESGAERS